MKKRMVILFAVLIACIPLIAPAARAQQATPVGPDGPATAAIRPDRIEWQPHIKNASVILVVAGPGEFRLEKQFPAGVPIALAVDDGTGEAMPRWPVHIRIAFPTCPFA